MRIDGAPEVAEFFAGIGLVRLALEDAGFAVTWSNDYDANKHKVYSGHFGPAGEFVLGDIGQIRGADLPSGLALAWASFPCTDLSLAGDRCGLDRGESKAFWEFIRIIGELGERAPSVLALENVAGLATSRGGDDLRSAVRALNDLGYSVDVLTLDARQWVPQSRVRLFMVAARNAPGERDDRVSSLRPAWLQFVHQDSSLRTHAAVLTSPPLPVRGGFSALAERMADDDPRWWDVDRTARALESLSSVQAARLALLRQRRTPAYRTGYRRTRSGAAVWEFREDDIAGCLRTPRGGSSKQAVLCAGGGTVRVRWMTPLEYARLMGAGSYQLGHATDAQLIYGFGDAVCVPVVRWLAVNYLRLLVNGELDAVPSLRGGAVLG